MKPTIKKKYTPTEELRELSSQFIIDAHQFALQADILLSNSGLIRHCQYHIGYLSKIGVMLYMAIECSLKSLICATHLTDPPNMTYWNKIRKGGHSFADLANKIPDISSVLNDTQVVNELNRLSSTSVSERYCLDVSSESDLLGGININDAALADKITEIRALHATASRLEEIVRGIRKAAFDGHRVLHPSAVKPALQGIKKK